MESQESIFNDIASQETAASFFHRLIANLIDVVIELGSMIALYILLPAEIRWVLITTNGVYTYLVFFIWITLYRFIMLSIYKRTIGMIICKVKYLNSSLQPLTRREKITATFALRTNKIKVFKV